MKAAGGTLKDPMFVEVMASNAHSVLCINAKTVVKRQWEFDCLKHKNAPPPDALQIKNKQFYDKYIDSCLSNSIGCMAIAKSGPNTATELIAHSNHRAPLYDRFATEDDEAAYGAMVAAASGVFGFEQIYDTSQLEKLAPEDATEMKLVALESADDAPSADDVVKPSASAPIPVESFGISVGSPSSSLPTHFTKAREDFELALHVEQQAQTAVQDHQDSADVVKPSPSAPSPVESSPGSPSSSLPTHITKADASHAHVQELREIAHEQSGESMDFEELESLNSAPAVPSPATSSPAILSFPSAATIKAREEQVQVQTVHDHQPDGDVALLMASAAPMVTTNPAALQDDSDDEDVFCGQTAKRLKVSDCQPDIRDETAAQTTFDAAKKLLSSFVVKGIKNMHNDCFIVSSLLMFNSIPIFRSFFITAKRLEWTNAKHPGSKLKGKMFNAMSDFVCKYTRQQVDENVVITASLAKELKQFKKEVSCFCPRFYYHHMCSQLCVYDVWFNADMWDHVGALSKRGPDHVGSKKTSSTGSPRLLRGSSGQSVGGVW